MCSSDLTQNEAQPDLWEPGSINGIGGSVPPRDTEQGVWALNLLGTGHKPLQGVGGISPSSPRVPRATLQRRSQVWH